MRRKIAITRKAGRPRPVAAAPCERTSSDRYNSQAYTQAAVVAAREERKGGKGFRALYRAPGQLLTFTQAREYINRAARRERYAVSLILIKRRMDIARQLHSNTSTPLANKITYLTLPLFPVLAPPPPLPLFARHLTIPTLKTPL